MLQLAATRLRPTYLLTTLTFAPEALCAVASFALCPLAAGFRDLRAMSTPPDLRHLSQIAQNGEMALNDRYRHLRDGL
jgi:hypothetical protein